MSKKGRLGKGLSALLGQQVQVSNAELEGSEYFKYLDPNLIEPDPAQPRKDFSEEHISELADSIKHHGIINPVIVSQLEIGKYRLIAGERRWRAAQIIGLGTIPAIIRDLDAKQRAELALIENIQRQDLNCIEEAEAYFRLAKDYGHSQEELAVALGKSRSYIANILRLNNLPPQVKGQVRAGLLSMGQARALLTAQDIPALADMVIAKKMSVRQIELLVRNQKHQPAKPASVPDSDTEQELANIATALSEKFDINVEVKAQTGDRYQLIWHVDSIDQLDDLLQQLT